MKRKSLRFVLFKANWCVLLAFVKYQFRNFLDLRASAAGVKIDLIVRGVCALRPGVPGVSENIKVRSIIGRFLEHHRIFYFFADGEEVVYLSSADWMERNFFRRIEIGFPILDARAKRRVIKEGLRAYLADTSQAWEMDATGQYALKTSTRRVCAQDLLLEDMRAAD